MTAALLFLAAVICLIFASVQALRPGNRALTWIGAVWSLGTLALTIAVLTGGNQ